MSQAVEKLQKERLQGIGGSDSPVILGVSPFKSKKELWLEKRGLVESPSPTPAMKRGIFLEPIIAKIYQEVTGRKLRRRKKVLSHKKFPFLIAHVDREITSNSSGSPGILEIKCPGLRVFSQCKREGLPEYYYVQLQHYLAVTGREWGSFAVFNAERWELLHFDVERDDELIDLIIQKDNEFWKLVQDGICPDDYYKDLEEQDVNLPKVGGKFVNLDGDPQWIDAIEDLKTAKEILDDAQALYDAAKEKIQNIMTQYNAEVAEGAGVRVYWSWSPGRTSYDVKRIFKDHPEIDPEKYKKTGKPYRSFRPFFLEQYVTE